MRLSRSEYLTDGMVRSKLVVKGHGLKYVTGSSCKASTNRRSPKFDQQPQVMYSNNRLIPKSRTEESLYDLHVVKTKHQMILILHSRFTMDVY